MKLRIVSPVLVTGLLLIAAAAQQNGIPNEVQTVLQNFSKSALRAHMDFLADDLLEGRGTGTRGQEIAAKYVATQFEAAGLEPAGLKSSYLQPVPLREIQVQRDACEVAIVKSADVQPLKWGADYVTRGSELSTEVSVEAPVVFAGYGVINRQRNYDDYAGLDVKGKIVAVFLGAPASFRSEERAHFASGVEKSRIAAARGAVGYLALRTPETDALLPWNRSVIGAALPAFRWLDPNGVPNDSFKELRAGATLSNEGADRLFAGAPESWSEVQKEAKNGKLHGFDLPVNLRLPVVRKTREVPCP